jgi:hypothetical protein
MKTTTFLKMVLCTLFSLSIFSCENDDNEGVTSMRYNVYLILDGSGSGQNNYAVPKIDIASCEQLIDSISYNGGGCLFINHVDKDGNNNKATVIHVPSIPPKPILRERIEGEFSYQYDKVIEQFKIDSSAYKDVFLKSNQVLSTTKSKYLPEIENTIREAYRAKSRGEDYSDIIGVLNAANKSLQATQDGKKVILAFSDLEQSLPQNTKGKSLKLLSNEIQLIRVNGSDSGEKVCKVTHEADNFEVALQSIFN